MTRADLELMLAAGNDGLLMLESILPPERCDKIATFLQDVIAQTRGERPFEGVAELLTDASLIDNLQRAANIIQALAIVQTNGSTEKWKHTCVNLPGHPLIMIGLSRIL